MKTEIYISITWVLFCIGAYAFGYADLTQCLLAAIPTALVGLKIYTKYGMG